MIDAQLHARARRAQNRRLALVFGLVLVMYAGFVIARLMRDDRPDGSLSPLLQVAVLAMPLVLTILMFGVVLLLRRRRIGMFKPSIAAGLDRDGRRTVLRAIRSGQHLQGVHEQAALDTARQLVGLRWILVFYPLLFGFTVVRVLTQDVDVLGLVILLCALFGIAGLALSWRDIRRARAYLHASRDHGIQQDRESREARER